MMTIRIALIGSHTLDLLARSLAEGLRRRGIGHDVWVGPFGRYYEQMLESGSELVEFDPTHVVVVVDFTDIFADLVGNPITSDVQRATRVDRELAQMSAALRQLSASRPDAVALVCSLVAPPRTSLGLLEHNSSYSLREVAWRFNLGLRELRRSHPKLLLIDYDGAIGSMGYTAAYDDRLWALARMHLSSKGTEAVANEIARLLVALVRPARKCVVVDLDGTLWGGAVGEGSGEVDLSSDGVGLSYVRFQEELRQLKERGVLLAVASRNNAAEALAVIENHPSMILRRGDFASIQIDWNDKTDQLRKIAADLGIGLGSLLFVDEDPVQRDLVASQLPEVETLPLGRDPSSFAETLRDSESLLTVTLTDEDRERAELYQRRAMGEELRRRTLDLNSFYAALEIRVTVGRATVSEGGRIAQLTQRTNQFTLTGRRYGEQMVRSLIDDPAYRVYWLRVSDRYGDHGLVGGAIVQRRNRAWYIESLLLSCRVLGRTVERAFLAYLVGEARLDGANQLEGEFRATGRNVPAADFYSQNLFVRVGANDDRWCLDLDGTVPNVPSYITVVSGSTAGRGPSADFTRI
jgi:FkbH-like protein